MTGAQTTEQRADWTCGTLVVLVSTCPACGHRWYIARPRCPRCASADVRRGLAARTGTVAAVTTISPRLSQDGKGVTLALVDLDDGIRIMACAAPELTVGTSVLWFFPDPDQAPGKRPVPHIKAVEQ